jgi:hypothetical protein
MPTSNFSATRHARDRSLHYNFFVNKWQQIALRMPRHVLGEEITGQANIHAVGNLQRVCLIRKSGDGCLH